MAKRSMKKKRSKRINKFHIIIIIIVLLVAVMIYANYQGKDTAVEPCIIQIPAEGQVNLFANHGFEQDSSPWCVLHPPMFKVSNERAYSGQHSARLHLDESSSDIGAKVHYLVQEIATEKFPEFISGYYWVDKWNKGTPDQYLQFVVGVIGAENIPLTNVSNHQIRYPLAGISSDPFGIRNAKFVYIDTNEPRVGEWVYFERNIEEDFEQLWGSVPKNFSSIRYFFEVRYDNKTAGSSTEAIVYYDDLYLGPVSDNPNAPL